MAMDEIGKGLKVADPHVQNVVCIPRNREGRADLRMAGDEAGEVELGPGQASSPAASGDAATSTASVSRYCAAK